ncbi:MAG: transcription-repair coupling factor [Clostridia bacterium]|nr:transcription-repair coupling factor [Clostridia bacterium]
MAAFVASFIAEKSEKKVLLVCQNDLLATRSAEDARSLMGTDALQLPAAELDLVRGSTSHENAWRRLESLQALALHAPHLLVTSMDALVQPMGDPGLFRESFTVLHPGDRLNLQSVSERLVHFGYQRTYLVEGKGQFALRGSILDVYPPDSAHAIRIELFDDEIDTLRTFDPISQRSEDHLEEFTLGPACEILLKEEDARRSAEKMRALLRETEPEDTEAPPGVFDELPPIPDDDEELAEYFEDAISPRLQEQEKTQTQKAVISHGRDALIRDAESLENGLPFKRMMAWLPVLTDTPASLFDWYQPEITLYMDPAGLRRRCDERQKGFLTDLTAAMERGEAVQAQEKLLFSWETLAALDPATTKVTVTDLTRGTGNLKPTEVIHLTADPLAGYASHFKQVAADCEMWLKKGYTVALLSGGTARGKRLQSTLLEMGIDAAFQEDTELDASHTLLKKGTVTILPQSLSHGFVWPEAALALVADADIWGSGFQHTHSRKHSGEKIASFTDLNVGDYVVHEDHGVGIYLGTKQMETDGAKHEYIQIQYLGNDKLYVPIEQLARVQRYIGNPSQLPKLNSIGGREWSKQKGKVRDSIRKMAFDLAALYAKREQQTGFAFSQDTTWQREFEDQFPFELTPDQKRSVEEITRDMESHRNMDRLLCGDVGYGKTEVSLRAAFKAVMDSKQVALLAPTTILAQQHFRTIQKRFAGFPVNVDVLSRFRTPKQQKDILQRLSEGKIDILVGTHKILGKDVRFKNLGLLIVDEEQRFGVQHKEVIKNMKNQIDVLTLSATPIPRTLHMSMVGIRDMSVLESPPEDRMPVQTHVIEYSDALIRDAILREVSRGGQVYFLYNRVQSIGKFYDHLHALVPEVRVGLAHGQMKEHGLEDVMMDFYAGSYDVLLCTTIIESGLDVPTANTLIVYDAERFGLSQLYQLRGRVGRSNVQAYAYFTVREDRMLSETAQQRLHAIREFTEFGSGFRIAMRDLEIRGAGNILGPEQHGHLAAIGYEMYCKLIEEAMYEVQGKAVAPDLETRVDLKVDAYIPASYIADEHQRMEMYKKIAAFTSDAEREDLVDELIDRFGEMPPVLTSLLDVSQMRGMCNHLGISHVVQMDNGLSFRFEAAYVKDVGALIRGAQNADGRFVFVNRKNGTYLTFNAPGFRGQKLLEEGLRAVRKLLASYESLLPAAEKPAS